MNRAEVLIAGGGCAGLSLGRELALAFERGENVLTTVILESRKTYSNDRTWCFWRRNAGEPDPRIKHQWSTWRFSTPSENVIHQSDTWSYCCVPAEAFYRDALERIEACPKIHLHRSTRITGHHFADGTHRVETKNGTWEASYLIDTLPPEKTSDTTGLMQCFLGVELESDTPDPTGDQTVGLMDQLQVDTHGLRFEYILPLSPTRKLIEVTRFHPGPISVELLEKDLQTTLQRFPHLSNAKEVRRESGMIPMGCVEATTPRWKHAVTAGTSGGAVRAASGYAFQRIHHWAVACARSLVEDGQPVGHPKEPAQRKFMDHLFLSVLRDQPQRSPDLFMDLARKTSPEKMVRFLSDEGNLNDALSVIRALPKTPFLRQLCQNTFSSKAA